MTSLASTSHYDFSQILAKCTSSSGHNVEHIFIRMLPMLIFLSLDRMMFCPCLYTNSYYIVSMEITQAEPVLLKNQFTCDLSKRMFNDNNFRSSHQLFNYISSRLTHSSPRSQPEFPLAGRRSRLGRIMALSSQSVHSSNPEKTELKQEHKVSSSVLSMLKTLYDALFADRHSRCRANLMQQLHRMPAVRLHPGPRAVCLLRLPARPPHQGGGRQPADRGERTTQAGPGGGTTDRQRGLGLGRGGGGGWVGRQQSGD